MYQVYNDETNEDLQEGKEEASAQTNHDGTAPTAGARHSQLTPVVATEPEKADDDQEGGGQPDKFEVGHDEQERADEDDLRRNQKLVVAQERDAATAPGSGVDVGGGDGRGDCDLWSGFIICRVKARIRSVMSSIVSVRSRRSLASITNIEANSERNPNHQEQHTDSENVLNRIVDHGSTLPSKMYLAVQITISLSSLPTSHLTRYMACLTLGCVKRRTHTSTFIGSKNTR